MEGTWVLWVGGYLLFRDKVLGHREKKIGRALGQAVGQRLRAADEAHKEDMKSLRQEVKELRELLLSTCMQHQQPAPSALN